MKYPNQIRTDFSVTYETIKAHSQIEKYQSLDIQLLFVRKGKGWITTDLNHTPYESGDVFFIRRNKDVEIKVDEYSEIFRLSISEEARLALKDLVESSNGKALRPAKIQAANTPKIALNKDDLPVVDQLFNLLVQLSKNPNQNENIMYFQCMCLISIIERNVQSDSTDPRPVAKPKINFILRHIHKNLTDPELLTLKYMSKKFDLTPNRLGLYFKDEMKQSVKQYIIEYRMKEIGKKVKKGNQTFSEIAYQYGFTDESHFYKAFKAFYKKSPTDYRVNKK